MKRILPAFDELEVYAAGQEDLPQRFYISPEQETFTDWKVSVGDKVLPVHSQVLCLSSKVFGDMITSGVTPKIDQK